MLITILLATFILFVMWIVTANVNEYTREGQPMYLRAPATVWVLTFIVVDVVYNVTIGSLLFWQWPHRKRLTLTLRMKHILQDSNELSWRWKVSWWVCRYLISPWQYNHCGLKLGEQP